MTLNLQAIEKHHYCHDGVHVHLPECQALHDIYCPTKHPKDVLERIEKADKDTNPTQDGADS